MCDVAPLHTAIHSCVDMRIGKGWAKGRSAADDPRIARAGNAHRGLIYRPRRTASPGIGWSPRSAYAVGLIATDGCLIRDGRHIAFVTQDEELMKTFLACIDHTEQRYRKERTRIGNDLFRIQLSDANLYRWLIGVGLTPRKSLSLGAIDVPAELFAHTVRGLLDGDGSVYVARHRPTLRKYPNYWYVRLRTLFTSASHEHVKWLRAQILCTYGLYGAVQRVCRAERHDMFRLVYEKRESLVLLNALYADASAPCLQRKKAVWLGYLARNGAEGGT